MLPADLSAAAPRRAPLNYVILYSAAYLTTAGVAAAELLQTPLGPRFAWTAALLAAFAAVLVAVFRALQKGRRVGAPLLVLLASAVACVITAVGASTSLGTILLFLLCAIVGMQFPVAGIVAWVAGANAALFVCLLLSGVRSPVLSLLSYDLGFLAFAVFSIVIRRALQARAESQQLLEELTSDQGRLRDLAIMEERQRLAREMHDAVGHRLTATAVLLEGAARLIPTEPSRATRMVETSRAQVRQGLDELRAAVSALRADTHGSQTLSDVLAALVEVFAQGGEPRVTLDIQPGMAEPDPDRKLVIIRAAQEALTNVQKHAAATRVELALRVAGDAYVLTCRDDGRGMAAEPATDGAPGMSGFGLGNMRARAAVFGGRVDLEAVPGGGTALRLSLPATAAAHHG
jgi:signal transduction histidine kinase